MRKLKKRVDYYIFGRDQILELFYKMLIKQSKKRNIYCKGRKQLYIISIELSLDFIFI